MPRLEDAEAYARTKNVDVAFCKSIVFRLKSIGVTDENILCAAYLYNARSGFDEIFSRFGREIATVVVSISKDMTLPRQRQQEQYVKQMQEAPWGAVLIKLCEASANLKFIKETEMSKTKRAKMLKQNIHLLNILKRKVVENKAGTPGIERLLDGLNETLGFFKQKPIAF